MTFIDDAKKFCEKEGHRYTEPRARVLDILFRSKNPMSAYDIVAAMKRGTKAPTVYRALEFWEGQGFIHKVASLNAYTVCHADDGHGAGHCAHGPQFLICNSCDSIAEIHACHLPSALERQAQEKGFSPHLWSVEIRGLCSRCQA